MNYPTYGFVKMSRNELYAAHPVRYGIYSIRDGETASIQVVMENTPGYEDVFQKSGNILNYTHSTNESHNEILNSLKSISEVHVYLNAKSGGCWSCGVYNIIEKFSWGWRLERKN